MYIKRNSLASFLAPSAVACNIFTLREFASVPEASFKVGTVTEILN